jgi:hypothetical protein
MLDSPLLAIQHASVYNADVLDHTVVQLMLRRLTRRVFLTNLRLGANKIVTPLNEIRRRTRLHVQHHLHCLLPERYHSIQAGEVEIILDKIFRDFTEVLVPRQGAKPANPCKGRCRSRRC